FGICPKAIVNVTESTFCHRIAAIVPSALRKLLRNKRRATLLALLIVITALALGRFGLFLLLPAGRGERVELVELGRGRTLRALSAELEKRGLVSSARLFALYARVKGADAKVKAGVYQFDNGMLPGRILEKMLTGEVYERLFAL